ncbi:type IV-A pilus assembly ATPase PilB [Candidatus Sororendozoicomonas aggregata]|uniref:type IV-A pilus assembly ATPase PilB n=1 Tax=Candidatus Sororendozoicomonas aggregata TaxID=3073239 RepID=UPI002ED11DA8
MADKPLTGLAARLVAEEFLSEEKVRSAMLKAQTESISLSNSLVSSNLVASRDIAELTSKEFGIPVLNISTIDMGTMDKELAPLKLIRKHQIMPLVCRGKHLFVAVTDPTQEQVFEEFRFNTGKTIHPVIVEEGKLGPFIERVLDDPENALSDDDDDDAMGNVETAHSGDSDQGEGEDDETDAPVVKFVNKMLLSAIKGGASDLHFEPYEKSYRVRFRTDGVLEEITRPPITLAPKISSRLKIMSEMDISERRKPQDGRIKLKLSKTKAIDFRVNTCPTLWGEKIVLRILDSSSAQMGIDALGYEEDQKGMYMEALYQPQGMILVTGPTGSGKTVSLYTGLNILNTTERNISTAEDPVEINLDGINQVNVNPKQGMDFAEALRAFLRQDPDIIMVGEIRDLETANIAIKAAQTGHMVMSTLHTNSAPETLTRLQNMGVPPFNIATSVSLIIAQRLARRLCNRCKEELSIPEETLISEGFTADQLKNLSIYGPVGCDQCNKGYKGRVGIYEVVKMTPDLQKIVMAEGNSLEIAAVAQKAGFNNLRQSGIIKVIEGVTTLEEVNRVTSE